MRKQPRKLDASELKQYALRLLAGRALSTDELRAKLTARALEPSRIEGIVEYLRDLKFLDDTRFAQHYTRLRLEGDGHGRARVLRDLRQRKVATPLAEKTVSDAFAGVDEVAMIEKYLARKFKNTDLAAYLREEKHLASAYRKLRLAGFGSANTIRVLRGYSSRADEIDDSEDPGATDNSVS
jgi:regulatory protein